VREVVPIALEAVVPTTEDVLRAQGIPPTVTPNRQTLELARRSADLYRELARPSGVWSAIPIRVFGEVFNGEGQNAFATPVEDTVRQADDLALFAVTVGEKLTSAIGDLFARHDPALASMLDAQASEGAELAAAETESRYVAWLTEQGRFNSGSGALRYSPGYCGWHVSGQRKLFAHLLPQEVGITLRESFLMQPLKSISGVVIAGRKQIFDFENTFDFCDDCSTWTCRERISAVMGGARDEAT
jgi:hypothetical protein